MDQIRTWALSKVFGQKNLARIYVSKEGSDTNSGNEESPFLTISKGVSVSSNGDTVFVGAGTYFENVVIQGKNILLSSHFFYSQDTSFISSTIIDGGGNSACILIDGSFGLTPADVKILGLMVKNGGVQSQEVGGGIVSKYNNNLEVENCIILDNTGVTGGGTSVFETNSISILNTLIKDNYAEEREEELEFMVLIILTL